MGPVPPPQGSSRFYLPSSTALSRQSSRHDRKPSNMSLSASASVPTSPKSSIYAGDRRHLRSRSSLAALRAVLQDYQIPPEDHPSESDGLVSEMDLRLEGRSLGLMSPFDPGNDMMDALVDIHRVLYRGRENMDDDNELDKEEIRRVTERWFEGDCSYDHPLVQLTSRSSLLSHFQLLHLVSSLYLPSISPRALVEHTRSITSHLKTKMIGTDAVPRDLERTVSVKGKEKAVWDLEDVDERESGGRWWKVWDVRADCREIGGMECYDGYHLALIEHTITLTLLPSLSSRHNSISSIPSSPATYATDETPSPLQARLPNPAFLTRLARSLAEEFDYLLHWDLPISTLVEFNEVGKATKIRDVIDVRDAIETFVPFAKRVGWLGRRVAGLVTSTVGAIVMGLVARPQVVVMQGIRVEGPAKPSSAEKIQHDYTYGLGLGELSLRREGGQSSFGLENVAPDVGEGSDIGSMAPDCDDQTLDL